MKKVWNKVVIFLSGMLMSVADIIPGFSGGIVLTMTGKIKEVWSNSKKIIKPKKKGDRKRAIIFYAIFIMGSLAGVFAFSQLINYLLTNIPAITFWFFVGITISSIPVFFIYNNMKVKEIKERKSRLGFLSGFTVILTLVVVTFLLRGTFQSDDIKQDANNKDYMYSVGIRILVCFSGFLAAAAMVTPGVSGALIILMLGTYGYIYDGLYAHPNDHVVFLITYMLSTVAGTITSLLFLDSLYKRFTRFMNWMFIGTILASFIGMTWLFSSFLIPDVDWKWPIMMFAFLLGISVNGLMFYIQYRRNKIKEGEKLLKSLNKTIKK